MYTFRTHGDLVFVAYFSNLRDFFGRLGIGHSDWELVDVDGGPFRVPMQLQVFVIRADGIVPKCKPQFRDCLSVKSAKTMLSSLLRDIRFPIQFLRRSGVYLTDATGAGSYGPHR
jgi:hypothetical protein